MELSDSVARWLSRLGFGIALAITCYSAMGTNVFGDRPWPSNCVDYHVIYDASLLIARDHVYPAKHAYPPSSVALDLLLAQLPFPWSAAVFMGLTIVATMACWGTLVAFFPNVRLRWLVLVTPAYLVTLPFVAWDLRSQNCNMIYCAAVLTGAYALHRGRCAAAGFWIALSFSLKLFSVLLIPYLAWRRQWRALGWTLAFVAAFWLALPWAVFGGDGMVAVYRDWSRQMRSVGTEHADLAHPISISLHNAALLFFADDASAAARLVFRIRAAWVAVGIAGAAYALRRPTERPGARPHGQKSRDAYGLLVDVGLLILGPIAVSPYLETFHAAPMIIPVFLLLVAVFDPARDLRWRVAAGAVLAGLALLNPAMVPFGYRGIPVNAVLWTSTSAALFLAWSNDAPNLLRRGAEPASGRRTAAAVPLGRGLASG
jgi:hypothetical protein